MTAVAIAERLHAVKTTTGWKARCPAHEDSNPSLSISEGTAGQVLLYCHAGCKPESVCAAAGLRLADLFPSKPKRNGTQPRKAPVAKDGKQLKLHANYELAIRAAQFGLKQSTGADYAPVAKWLYQNRNGTECAYVLRLENPAEGSGRNVYRPLRAEPGGWRLCDPDTAWPVYHLPEILSTAGAVVVCEGEKAADAARAIGILSTCSAHGAGSAKKTNWTPLAGRTVYILPDNDSPGQSYASEVAAILSKLTPPAIINIVRLPGLPESGDIVEFVEARDSQTPEEIKSEIQALADAAPIWTAPAEAAPVADEAPAVLTLRSPDEILAAILDPADCIWGDYLLAKGQSLTLLGPGGCGKSRLVLQLAAAAIAGRPCIGIETHGAGLRWLVLQIENGNRRLQSDFKSLRAWIGPDDWPTVNSLLSVHTLENDSDGMLNLENPDNQTRIAQAIEAAKPDVIVIDPLNQFCIGDPNSDRDMTATCAAIAQLCRQGNPHRASITLHHALTGKAGGIRAVGADRSSFGRNSKALFAWTRGQINLAPINEHDNELLAVSCGKCSNGREFAPFAVRLNPSMVYEVAPDIDLVAWREELAGRTASLMNPDRVRELCRLPMTKAELAKAIMDDCGCYRGSAYRYITRAEQARKIHFNKDRETYCPK